LATVLSLGKLRAMEGWTLFYMIVILKIPLVAALWIIWYAIKQEPAADEEGASGRKGPRQTPPRRPPRPRRPAGGVGCRPSPCPQLATHRLAGRTPLPARRG
jgi:hypothetical protein